MLEKYVPLGECREAGEKPYIDIHKSSLEKRASEVYTPDSLLERISNIKPRPDGRYILVNALGAGEYWACNSWGDYFPEWSIKGDDTPKDVEEFLKRNAAHVPNFGMREKGEYGLDTYKKYGYVYVEHRNNKDPKCSIGSIVDTAYNDKMHRGEAIIFIRTADAPSVVARIDDGTPIAFSMGSFVPVDVCSICRNVARHQSQFCDCKIFRNKEILPDGRQVYSFSYHPLFFDLSVVARGADKSAWALMKVASDKKEAKEILATPRFFLPEPRTQEESTINEQAAYECIDNLTNFQSSRKMIKLASGLSPAEAITSLTAAGVVLTPTELSYYTNNDPSKIPSEFVSTNVNVGALMKVGSALEKVSLFGDSALMFPASGAKNTLNYGVFTTPYSNFLNSVSSSQIYQNINTYTKSRAGSFTPSQMHKVAMEPISDEILIASFILGTKTLNK